MQPDGPLPPPPSLKPRRVPASTRTLSKVTIVDTALRLLDQKGLGAVTMRSVADELKTGPASLYAHVANKHELELELLDRVIGEVPRVTTDGDEWREQLKDQLRSMRDVLQAHKDVASLAMGSIPLGPNALDLTETLLGLLRAGSLSDRTVALGADLLLQFVVATACEFAAGWGEVNARLDDARAYSHQVRDYYKSLPGERFPNTVELAADLTTFNPEVDERFEFGLEVLLSGLEGYAGLSGTGAELAAPS